MKKRFYLRDTEEAEGNGFSVIADFEGNEEQLMDINVDEILPILPLRNMVLFPGVFMPVSVGRKSSLKLVREANKKEAYIGVVCQKTADTESPLLDDLHNIGTVGKIIRILEMPDQSTTVIIQGVKRMIREINGLREHITKGEKIDTTLFMEPADFLIMKNQQEMLSSPQLSNYIDRQRQRGFANIKEFEIEYHKRIAMEIISGNGDRKLKTRMIYGRE